MSLELIWFLPVITALLWMIGGTWWKAARRFILPATMLLAAWLFNGWSWWLLGLLLLVGATSLPFTLIGDGIDDHWFNKAWPFIKGLLIASYVPFVLLAAEKSLYASIGYGLFESVIFGGVFILSNTEETADIFQWKLCQFIFGAAVALPLCWILTL